MEPRAATARTAIAFGMPLAHRRVPSIGSTATSHAGPVPSPTSSPLNSIGALSFSPSPMTTMPCIDTELISIRIALTAAPSAPILSPRPTQRAAAIAAASVTRASSSARLRSGAAIAGCRRSGSRFMPPILRVRVLGLREGHYDLLFYPPLVLQRLQGEALPVRRGERRLQDRPGPQPSRQHHVDLSRVNGDLDREGDPCDQPEHGREDAVHRVAVQEMVHQVGASDLQRRVQ